MSAPLDLAIRGGTVVTHLEERRVDIGVAGEKIAAIGEVGPAAAEIDARGKLVLPGVIDMHTHLGGWALDDIAAGTRAAAAGGVTTVLSFAYQDPGGSLVAAAQHAVESATGATVDFAFHVVVDDPSERAIAELPDLVAAGHAGIKIFMVAPAFAPRAVDYLRLWRAAGSAGALTAVHAEDHALVVEACTSWRFVIEELRAAGIAGHLAEVADTMALRSPKRRAKTDRSDARHLRKLLVAGALPESWIPPEQHLVEIRIRHVLMEEVGHAVHEDAAWRSPVEWQRQHVRLQRDPEAVAVVPAPHLL